MHPFHDALVSFAERRVIIMMKTLKLPSVDEFEEALKEAEDWASSVGYQESDVDSIIKNVRKSKNV